SILRRRLTSEPRDGDRSFHHVSSPLTGPPTPSSNFNLVLPDLSSSESCDNDSGEEGVSGDDDIFPPGTEISGRLHDVVRSRLRASGAGSDSAFGANGSIHSEVIRRRRQLLEGRLNDDDGPKDVAICVIWTSGKFAAAYYDLESAQLFMLPDTSDCPPDFHILRSLFTQVAPTYVLVNKNSDDRFLSVIDELTEHQIVANSGMEETNVNADRNSKQLDSMHVYPLPPKEFGPEVCKQRVHSLKLPFEPKNISPQEHLMFITSLIPIVNENMVRAVGCLLRFLDRSAIELFQIELVGGHVSVLDVQLVKMDDLVLVDETAWKSLQIFSTDFHPSSFKQGRSCGSKEGLSVYGLLNQCKTTQGSRKLRLMLLRPLRSIDLLNRRYDAVSFCMSMNNMEFVKSTLDCLKSIKSIPKLLYRLSLLHAKVREWKEIYQAMYHCLLLGQLCGSLNEAPQIIKDIGNQQYLAVLKSLTHDIIRFVDFEESEVMGRIVAREGIDPVLDRKKKQFSCLPEIMSIVASEEITELPPFVNQCCVVYIPEVGYLLAISFWKEDLQQENLELPNLEFRFKTHEMAYYKSPRMRELDIILGDCSVAILEIETVVMVRLTNMILEESTTLLRISDLVSELDCLIAFSVVARTYDFVRPDLLPPGGKMKIINGKHPISDLIREFVPNSTVFKGAERVVVLTGPNASGKSVYLKQVGVIVIMALSGCYVPASLAEIPLFDRICTRIHAVETVSTGFSSFMVDMNQMSLAIRSTTRDSLVIIDEFGKGTAEADGLSVLASSMQSFINRTNDCPLIFLSTHFFTMIQHLKPSGLVKLQTMKFMEENDNITYLYELKDGQCESSFAQVIARNMNLPENIVKRALELEGVTRGRVDVIESEKTVLQAQKEEAIDALVDEFFQMDFDRVKPIAFFQRIKRTLDPLMET
ncbi:MutS protein 5, partial [Orchesella cincta]